jgi:hypothetical protein
VPKDPAGMAGQPLGCNNSPTTINADIGIQQTQFKREKTNPLLFFWFFWRFANFVTAIIGFSLGD